jgi:ribonuclease-3
MDKNLLKKAFSHSSYANEKRKLNIESNERLEFLGDAVLELVISEYIYNHFPKMPEGELTKFRASIVCETTLAEEARVLNIGNYIMLGKGEKSTGGETRNSILADAFESVIGAIFLDGGIECAKKHILGIMEPIIANLQKSFRTMDYKTYLQELVQSTSKETVRYEIIDEIGPDHDKAFIAQATHNRKVLGQGQGRTKKEAEQNAAFEALKKQGRHLL